MKPSAPVRGLSVFETKRLRAIPVACALLLAAAVPAGAVVLAVDDGTWESPLTSPGGPEIRVIVFNQFFGTGTVTDVRIDWSSVEDGRSFTVGIWSDPNGDGNPDDAVLLQSMTGTTIHGANDTPDAFFNLYDIADTPVTDSFFVGYSIEMLTEGSVAPIDLTASAERSWLAFGPVDDMQSFVHVAGEGSGNWLIRVGFEPVPEPSAAAALLLSLGLAAGRRQR